MGRLFQKDSSIKMVYEIVRGLIVCPLYLLVLQKYPQQSLTMGYFQLHFNHCIQCQPHTWRLWSSSDRLCQKGFHRYEVPSLQETQHWQCYINYLLHYFTAPCTNYVQLIYMQVCIYVTTVNERLSCIEYVISTIVTVISNFYGARV